MKSEHATAQVISLGELHPDTTHRHSETPLLQSANPLHSLRAQLKVCVGQVEVGVGELLAAREDHVLVLDRVVDEPVDLTIEGMVVARGHLVAVDGRFAVKISELPIAFRI